MAEAEEIRKPEIVEIAVIFGEGGLEKEKRETKPYLEAG